MKHQNEEELQCDSCSFITNTQENLNCHTKSRHTNLFEFKCNVCSFQTNRKQDLDLHRKLKHLGKIISCDRCDFVSKTEHQHRKHIEVRHENNPICWFWCNAVCRNDFCPFEHPPRNKFNSYNFQENNYFKKNSMNTRNMYTRVPGRYQDRCQNANCSFEHFLGPRQVSNLKW